MPARSVCLAWLAMAGLWLVHPSSLPLSLPTSLPTPKTSLLVYQNKDDKIKLEPNVATGCVDDSTPGPWYGMVWYGEVCEDTPVAVGGWVLTDRHVTLSLSEAGPERFGHHQSSTELYHAIPYVYCLKNKNIYIYKKRCGIRFFMLGGGGGLPAVGKVVLLDHIRSVQSRAKRAAHD